LGLSGFVAACGGGVTAPANVSGMVGVTRIEISGPESVSPGESARLIAIARFTNGSVRDVSADATWHSTDAAVLSVSDQGTATAHTRGETNIIVSYNGGRATKLVFGLPHGTYRLAGKVTENGLGVDGAHVEVMSGAGRGLTATTLKGEYRIYGVAGDTVVQVRKAEYEPAEQSIDLGQHGTLDFDLKPGL
jgi:hypothetical protein